MKHWIVAIIGWLTTIVGGLVMYGWFANVPFLQSIVPNAVTMKFTTALSFLLSGMVVILIHKIVFYKSALAYIMLPFVSLGIMILMGTLLVSVTLGTKTGIEDMFVQESVGAIKTAQPGRPSIGTMVDFILIALIGIFIIAEFKYGKYIIAWSSIIVCLIGAIALFGYALDIPALYYTISGISSAMAIHTAMLFFLIGFALLIVTKKMYDNALIQKSTI